MENNDIITSTDQVRCSGYKELTVKGKALYLAKCRELIKEGELRRCYLQTLILWSDCYDRFWRLRADVSQEGETFTSHNKFGDPVISANPKVKMMNDALRQANGILSEFGATLKQARKLGKEKPSKDIMDDWND